VPFDADLGRGPGGALAVVYSRCRVEPRRDLGGLRLPATGRGCRLYRFDTATGRETRVRGTGAEAFLPAIDASAIAFARRGRRGVGIYVMRDGTSRRLAGPRRSTPGPLTLDLRGHRVAVVWKDRNRTQVRLLVRGGRDRTVASAASARSAGFDGNVLSWVQSDDDRTIAVRLDLGSKARRELVLPQSANVYVPWSTWHGWSGSYGATGEGGWTLRTPLTLPELLR
jgi:hypothetical protein